MRPQTASWPSPTVVPWSACFPPLGDISFWEHGHDRFKNLRREVGFPFFLIADDVVEAG
jgi:hypothetical protein